ncbi:hypothetical protein HCI99_04345 [Listeria booriae]|uniref:Uncharacterized protein n=1 Tax=Listeria booriae TaxID=1552123 RepID=A0A7X0XBS9_9LIST|nr:hypothetical protein [Listeria booriae]MBC1491038.1 hypothetical protein [Listeria booriae]MBC1491047.1 hypothetical protein [Listeria booriae]MBC6151121.1 hypothetical protein [Listeria booriae]MBC6151130.1 hypothetical protein [Listeria booriae]
MSDTFVGTRVGNLVVVEATEEREHESIVYLCQCDCGNHIKRSRRHLNAALKAGAMSNCGCNYHNRHQVIGHKFGLLTILAWAEEAEVPSYICDCNCGETGVVVPLSRIKGSKNPSCGCYTKIVKAANFSQDIMGKRFGNLVAIQALEKRNWRYRVWLCQCDCGNTREATVGELNSGNTKSCGLDCEIRRKERFKYRAKAADPEHRNKYYKIRKLLLNHTPVSQIKRELHVGESPVHHIKNELIAEGLLQPN